MAYNKGIAAYVVLSAAAVAAAVAYFWHKHHNFFMATVDMQTNKLCHLVCTACLARLVHMHTHNT